MTVMHRDLSRLKNDSKALRKYVKRELNFHISFQQALDTIANCYQWENWNTLFLGHQDSTLPNGNHVYWHDLRINEKYDILNQTAKRAAEAQFPFHHLAIEEWLLNTLCPSPDPLHKKLHTDSFVKKAWHHFSPVRISYSDFGLPRFREGVCVSTHNSNYAGLHAHLANELLRQAGRPGCVIHTAQYGIHNDMTRWVEALRKQDYDISVMNKLHIMPVITADKSHPAGLYQYLSHMLQNVFDGPYGEGKKLLLDIILYKIEHTNKEELNLYEIYPSLPELIDTFLNDDAPKAEKEAIASYFDTFEFIAGSTPSAKHFEMHSFNTMQFTEITGMLQKTIESYGGHPFVISQIQRPEEKSALVLKPDDSKSHLYRQHAYWVNATLCRLWKEDNAQSDTFQFMSIIESHGNRSSTHGWGELDYHKANAANISTVFYGHYEEARAFDEKINVGTHITPGEHGSILDRLYTTFAGSRSAIQIKLSK